MSELSNAKKLPRRRNGKEQACEPCRKSKMRCDHALPHCQNCRRRSILERCIYVEAPQTKPKPHRSGSQSQGLSPVQAAAYEQAVGVTTISPEETGEARVGNVQEQPSILKPSSGFFGPTSFSAVFQDNEENLASKFDSPQDHQTPVQTAAENDRTMEGLSARTALGIRILNQLPNQTTCERLLDFYTVRGVEKAFHKPTFLYCMASFWTTFGQYFKQPRKSKDLRDVALLLTENTKSVLKDTDDPEVWLAQLSGRNIRWEMMGIILCNLGHVILALPEDDPILISQSGRRVYRKHFGMEMKEATDECVKLSNQMDNINILMVSLLYKRNILESLCTGDTSLMLWRAHGDMINASTGLGLHRERDPTSRPNISSEMKRRVWATVFGIDKTLAAFTGRPPGVSHRFNLCPLPLDLSDEVLLRSREEIDLAISQLDVNGWNQNGEFHAATSVRSVMVYSLIMSEILEISLGSEIQYSVEHLLYRDLKKRSDEQYSFLPPWLHLTKAPAETSTIQWNRVSLRLRYLHCSLLLEQLCVKRAQVSRQRLIDTAREMLEITVNIWLERDRFVDRLYDYDWTIMCYGIPSSGVICVELLNQIKRPRQPHPSMPRSEVIRNLSMLVGFLEWVRPTAVNGELCERMSVIIKGILDQVLEPPLLNDGLVLSSSTTGLIPMPELDFSEMEMSEFDWLETVDWTQTPFVDLSMGDFDGQF